jgi:hypothetical protein
MKGFDSCPNKVEPGPRRVRPKANPTESVTREVEKPGKKKPPPAPGDGPWIHDPAIGIVSKQRRLATVPAEQRPVVSRFIDPSLVY